MPKPPWSASISTFCCADGELIDSNVNRLRWFKEALRDFEAQARSPARPPLTSVAFPDKIGCGLAGGRWSDYLHEIEEFKRRNPLVRVIVIEDGR